MDSLQEMTSCLSEYHQRMARDEAIKVLNKAKQLNRPVIFLPKGISGTQLKHKNYDNRIFPTHRTGARGDDVPPPKEIRKRKIS